MSRRGALAAGVVYGVLCAAASFAAEPTCIDWEIAGAGIDELVVAAIGVLQGAGHDPADYRVELRMESMGPPELQSVGARLRKSVVFLPRGGAGTYAVRVHPKYPCELSWIWEPPRLTDWQLRVIRRAQAVMRETWPASAAGAALSELEVLETARTVSVRLWGGATELVVTLDKSSLDVAPSRGG